MPSTLKPLNQVQGAVTALNAARPAAASTKLQYEVELITPMMGGGAAAGTADQTLPYRLRSLRGQLRMWWRILARCGLLRNIAEPAPVTPAQWRAAERAIWGGISEDSEIAPSASRVGLYIEPGWRASLTTYEELTANGMPDLRYAIFPAERKEGDPGEAILVKTGGRFRLVVTIKDAALRDDVKTVIAWWATLGGLGARTRRGLGAVKVCQVLNDEFQPCECKLPLDNWVEAFDARSPRIDQGTRSFRADNGTLKALSQRVPFGTIFARGPAADNAPKVLARQLAALKGFRQDPGLGRGPGFGRSWWPESHVIRQATQTWLEKHNPTTEGNAVLAAPMSASRAMPRADFGLPIVMHFKDGPDESASGDVRGRDPATRSIMPTAGRDRMASPLILRPVARPSGKTYVPVAFVFDAVVLGGDGGRLLTEVTIDPVAGAPQTYPVWPAVPSDLSAHAPLVKFLRGRAYPLASTAVEAFANYLVEEAP